MDLHAGSLSLGHTDPLSVISRLIFPYILMVDKNFKSVFGKFVLVTDNWYTCNALIKWIKEIECYFVGTARLIRVSE